MARVRIPSHDEHPFRTKMNTYSVLRWTLIPGWWWTLFPDFRNRCSTFRNECSTSRNNYL